MLDMNDTCDHTPSIISLIIINEFIELGNKNQYRTDLS